MASAEYFRQSRSVQVASVHGEVPAAARHSLGVKRLPGARGTFDHETSERKPLSGHAELWSFKDGVLGLRLSRWRTGRVRKMRVECSRRERVRAWTRELEDRATHCDDSLAEEAPSQRRASPRHISEPVTED